MGTLHDADRREGIVAASFAVKSSIGYAVLADAMERGMVCAIMENRDVCTVEVSSALVEYAEAGNKRHSFLTWPRTDFLDDSTSRPISGLIYFAVRVRHQHLCPSHRYARFLEWCYIKGAPIRAEELLGFGRLLELIREEFLLR